jgi:hypothetical protein
MMKKELSSAVLALAVSLAGCATQQPQTADEFRQAVPGAFMAKKETFEVNRPFRAVADTFRKRAPECLSRTVRTTTSQPGTSYQVVVADYKPTVVVTGERAELHVQERHKQGVIRAVKEPEDGHYLVVADAYPLERNRTRLEIFGPTGGPGALIIRTVKSWASGESSACPDFTR